MQPMTAITSSASGVEDRIHAADQEHAGGDHRRRVHERGDRRRAFHRVGQPRVQRELALLPTQPQKMPTPAMNSSPMAPAAVFVRRASSSIERLDCGIAAALPHDFGDLIAGFERDHAVGRRELEVVRFRRAAG